MPVVRSCSASAIESDLTGDVGQSRIVNIILVAIIGVVAAIAAGMLIDRLLSPNRIVILDADPGDCFTLPIDPALTELIEIDRQDCSEPHNAEVVSVGELNPEGARAYPEDELLFDIVDVVCGDPRRFLDDGFGLLPVAPNERSWEGQHGRYVCVAVSLGGEMVSERRIEPEQDVAPERDDFDQDPNPSAIGRSDR